MERPLFDKPMSELREAFVRARFAEKNVFNNADIEGTRSDPRVLATRITGMPRVSAHLEDVWDGGWARRMSRIHVLRKNATDHAAGFPDWCASKRVTSLLETLRSGGARIFFTGCVSSGEAVVAIGNRIFAMDVPKPGAKRPTDCTLRPATMRDVTNVLVEEIREGRPKANEAARFLSEQIEVAVKCAREEAERDFNEAVAVSADGTRIVKADWVLVIDERETTLFPGTTFRVCKAKLRHDLGRGRIGLPTMENTAVGVASYLARIPDELGDLRDRREDFRVFECGPRDSAFKTLAIRADLCPSPLPEGGTLLR